MADAATLARAVQTAATLSAFGAAVFEVTAARAAFTRSSPEQARAFERRLDRVVQASLLAATLAAAIWLVIKALDLSGATGLAEGLTAVGLVVQRTQFGLVEVFRIVFAIVALTLWRRTLKADWGAGAVMLIAGA